MNANTPSFQSRFLWFERAGQAYAVSMNFLREVVTVPSLRPVPGAEPALTGLIVLHEQVLPVLDPVCLQREGAAPPAASPIVVVLGMAGAPCLGLLAERVGKVVELPQPGALASPPRVAAAFAGQVRGRETPQLLVVDVPTLAAAMGLAEAPAPAAAVHQH